MLSIDHVTRLSYEQKISLNETLCRIPRATMTDHHVAVHTFLRQVLPDKETVDTLLLWLARCRYRPPQSPPALIFHGSGANGKCTLASLIERAFGNMIDHVTVDNAMRVTEYPLSIAQELSSDDDVDHIMRRIGGRHVIFVVISFRRQIPENAILIRFNTRFTLNPKLPHEKLRDRTLPEKSRNWVEAFQDILRQRFAVYILSTNEAFCRSVQEWKRAAWKPPHGVMVRYHFNKSLEKREAGKL